MGRRGLLPDLMDLPSWSGKGQIRTKWTHREMGTQGWVDRGQLCGLRTEETVWGIGEGDLEGADYKD